GELRCLLLLALGEHEEALDMAEWVVTFGASTLSPKRERFYACIIEQLQLALDDTRNADDYAWVQRQLYGDSIYQAACEHIAGRQKFYDLLPIDSNYQCFQAHRQLLKAYEKLQAAKQLADNAE
ncbi:MAG: 30S ribosomal protein S12 methylthiotransferase accessory protein YcaO, partial [Gammaproteobacteria bacterium]